MADVPWTTRAQMTPGHRYTVLASHLPLMRLSSTVGFFRAVGTIRKQLAGAAGLVGYTLSAKPATRRYWTLSVWDSEESLRAFVQARPHAAVMASLRPKMGQTNFSQWTITSADGLPTWTTAMERLGQP